MNEILRRFVKVFLVVLMTFPFWFTAYSKDLKLAVGLALPPYFIQDTKSGMELEIIQESLKFKGYRVVPVFLPFARVTKSMEDGKVDCASTINENSGVKAFYSDNHIVYQNFAVSLKKNKLIVNKISDLGDKTIISFQNATKYLGSEFKMMAENNSKYREKANQATQNKSLFMNRVQIIVGDVNIFKYFNKQVANIVDVTQPVIYHNLFPKTPYKVAFRQQSVRDDFNKGLKRIKQSGLYDKIITKYVE